VLAALALLASAPRARGEEEVLDEGWFVVRMLGRPAGFGHETTTRTTLDGRVAFLTKSEQTMAKRAGGKVVIEESLSESWEAEDGTFLRTREVERDAGQEQRLLAERVEGEIRIRRELNEGRKETTVAVPSGMKVYGGLGGRVLTLLGLEVGRKHAATCFSSESGELATETAEIEGRREVESLGKKVDAFVVRMTSSEYPGVVMTALCDAEGRLLQLTAGPVEIVRSTRAEAMAALAGGGLDESLTSIPLDGGVAAWPTLDAAVVEATVEGEGGGIPLFPEDEYHSVTGSGGRYRLELRALPAPETAAERLPIEPSSPEMRRYAEPALLVQSDAPEIKAEAERVLAGDRDPLSAARKLCRHVFAGLRKEKAEASTASALETLRAGAGDCTEHAALFCGLARAAGLPAREAYGVTFRAQEAGYHAWAEALIDGRWVPVDATIGVVGLPAAYIRLGTSQGDGTDQAGAPHFLRLLGRTRFAIVSATRRGTTFDPRDPAAVTRQEGDLWTDLGADFSVDLSGGWRYQSAQPPNTIFVSASGEAICVTVADAPLRSDEDWADFERAFGKSIGAALEREDEGDKAASSVRSYRYAMTRNGQPLAGRMRVVSAGPVLYGVNAIVKAEAADAADLEGMLGRVKLGGAGR
jgi:transglutaminase-like putative cysteine protease